MSWSLLRGFNMGPGGLRVCWSQLRGLSFRARGPESVLGAVWVLHHGAKGDGRELEP